MSTPTIEEISEKMNGELPEGFLYPAPAGAGFLYRIF
jgi:hypothetical protein